MHKLLKPFLAVLIAVVASLGVIACGDDDDDDGGGGGGEGKGGGELLIATTGLDETDPVMFLTTQSVQAYQLAYIGLLTYAHEEGEAGSKLIPGLAEDLPEESNGGKTLKFKLREGLKYSDGSPIKASDFENTMKRLLVLGSPWSSFYSPIIEGTEEFTEKGDMSGDISGIETNDKTGEITVTSTEADTKLKFALAEPYTSPTPAAKSPGKELDQPPPGTGPYILDIVDVNREYVLKRNPNFGDIPGVPKGNFDTIRAKVQDNVTKMTQDVINGKADFMTEDPVGDLLPEVREKYSDRYFEAPNPPNVYYTHFNITKPPFDKQEAREAVNYATDSRALARIFGGRLQPGCNFIPEGVVGHEEFECKYGDPNGEPDIEKAKELVEQSGYKGETVVYYTNNKDPRPAIADYFRDMLTEIGFKAEIKTLDQQVYFGKMAEVDFGAQTGFNDWFQDYPHPGDFIEVLLGSRSIGDETTTNFGLVKDPELDKKLDELRGEEPEDVADEWAALDEYVVNEKAWVAPYGAEESSNFYSERMDVENCKGAHPVYKTDWLQFCLK